MLSADPIKLSIVIPALNEERTIALCVSKSLRALKALGIPGEVVVADNGSQDHTRAIALEAGARVVPVADQGYGAACRGGCQAAKGEYLLLGDGDDSYNFQEIAHYYEKLSQGNELVIGNRFRGAIEPGAMPFTHRWVGTPFLTWTTNFFFQTRIGDVNCGMRALTREAFHRMRLNTTGMEFATEMMIKAALHRLKVAEVPCNLYKDKRDRKSHLNPWRDGWRHLRLLLTEGLLRNISKDRVPAHRGWPPRVRDISWHPSLLPRKTFPSPHRRA